MYLDEIPIGESVKCRGAIREVIGHLCASNDDVIGVYLAGLDEPLDPNLKVINDHVLEVANQQPKW